MSREQDIEKMLTELGIFHPAFRGEIHQLCILERELSRARKEWKRTAKDGETPSFTEPVYANILKIQAEIDKKNETLGLTPKALKRIKGDMETVIETKENAPTALSIVLNRHAAG